MERRCTICKKSYKLDANNFYRVKRKEFNGFGYGCKNCEKSRIRNRNRKRNRSEYFLKYAKNYALKQENKIKLLARKVMTKAIKDKILSRQPCVKCGNIKVDGHHPNYSKPLSVIWLCKKHHQELHKTLLKT